MTRRFARALGFSAGLVVIVACREGPPGSTPSATSKSCGPSSVAQNTTCPKRVVPPSNASSTRGCKSDADCKDGADGRCVDTGAGAAVSPPRTNLLGEAPHAPPATICVYDQCVKDADCGPKGRCVCGSGVGLERSACVALDQCLGDRDCGGDALCACGSSGTPNTCAPGTCRTDADCGGRACVADGAGKYCRSDRDACKSNEDCKGGFVRCAWQASTRSFGCVPIPPIPAG